MAVKLAINGFGRIGRCIVRALVESRRKDVTIVTINDLGAPKAQAHLLRFDSVHGRFPGEVTLEGDCLNAGLGPIKMTSEADVRALDHGSLGVDVVLECTGKFTNRTTALNHLVAGAKKVLISAPSEDADITIVYGINHHLLSSHHQIISNASCTTNCLAPLAKLLQDYIGIEKGFMTTIHAYTGDQPSVDKKHADLYRGRAAALSIVPTSTGAAQSIGLILPQLKGKLDGVSIRVPVPNVSAVDLKIIAQRSTNVKEINACMREAAQSTLRNILAVTDHPNVSCDFNHDPHSAIFHMDQTKVVSDNFVRVMAWYDNEWGFSNRMLDTASALSPFL